MYTNHAKHIPVQISIIHNPSNWNILSDLPHQSNLREVPVVPSKAASHEVLSRLLLLFFPFIVTTITGHLICSLLTDYLIH